MKYLVLLIVLAVAFGIWRSRRAQAVAARPRSRALPQDMLACAHCKVHIPRPDALVAGDRAYCCAEHQRLGPA
ncbi:MAG: PP0621 family protein [Acidovorax sp.]|uniref:PP0621 family protein n=1 Tax=Acidovorax sp. TaxID=1872122 RepID=UPI0039E314F6